MVLQLPPEIWVLIAGHLSPGKMAPLDPSDTKTSAWHGSLANLCLVSRTLHDLATPKLYECPMTRKTESLIRTLFVRPDLALYVKCLRHGTWNHWYEMSTVHEVEEFSELLMEHTERIEMRIDEEAPPALYMLEELQQMVEIATDDDTEPQVNDAVAFSIMGNLERLSLSSHFVPVCASSLPDSLPYLREAVVTNPGPDPVILPEHLAYLALAAPNLSELRVDFLMVTTPPEFTPKSYLPVFPNVTILDLRDAAISPDVCRFLFKAFPRLADLRCELTGEQPWVTMVQLQDALVQVHPRIKRLYLDVPSRRAPMGAIESALLPPTPGIVPWSPPAATLREFQGLATLKDLEYLAGDASSLIDGTGETPAETALSSVLPKNLRELRIFYTPFSPAVEALSNALKGLAKAAPDSLPLLKSVTFEHVAGFRLRPDVPRAFRDGGIEFEDVSSSA